MCKIKCYSSHNVVVALERAGRKALKSRQDNFSFAFPHTQSQIFIAHTWRMRNVKLACAAGEAAEKWAVQKEGRQRWVWHWSGGRTKDKQRQQSLLLCSEGVWRKRQDDDGK